MPGGHKELLTKSSSTFHSYNLRLKTRQIMYSSVNDLTMID